MSAYLKLLPSREGSLVSLMFKYGLLWCFLQAANEDKDEEEESRPSIDLFKAIFTSSSDEKSSSSEEESEEEQQQSTSVVDSETTKQIDPPGDSSSSVQGSTQQMLIFINTSKKLHL